MKREGSLSDGRAGLKCQIFIIDQSRLLSYSSGDPIGRGDRVTQGMYGLTEVSWCQT